MNPIIEEYAKKPFEGGIETINLTAEEVETLYVEGTLQVLTPEKKLVTLKITDYLDDRDLEEREADLKEDLLREVDREWI